jgi:hypothetical protein
MDLGKLRVNQLTAAGWDWCQRYLTALDAYDIDEYASYLSPEVVVRFNNDAPLEGLDAVREGLGGFWGSVTAMGYRLVHEPLNVYGDDRRFVLEALNHYDTGDERRITVRATAWTDRDDDGQVVSVRIYQDLAALYGRTA